MRVCVHACVRACVKDDVTLLYCLVHRYRTLGVSSSDSSSGADSGHRGTGRRLKVLVRVGEETEGTGEGGGEETEGTGEGWGRRLKVLVRVGGRRLKVLVRVGGRRLKVLVRVGGGD